MADREVWRTRVHRQPTLTWAANRREAVRLPHPILSMIYVQRKPRLQAGQLDTFSISQPSCDGISHHFARIDLVSANAFLGTNHTVAGIEMCSCYQAHDEGA